MHAQLPESGDGAVAPVPVAGPMDRAVEAIGDRWSLLIVHAALCGGATRFGDFTRALRIPSNILTQRLQALVHTGVFERVAAPQGRSPHEYRLTTKGVHLQPVVSALLAWGAEWTPAGE